MMTDGMSLTSSVRRLPAVETDGGADLAGEDEAMLMDVSSSSCTGGFLDAMLVVGTCDNPLVIHCFKGTSSVDFSTAAAVGAVAERNLSSFLEYWVDATIFKELVEVESSAGITAAFVCSAKISPDSTELGVRQSRCSGFVTSTLGSGDDTGRDGGCSGTGGSGSGSSSSFV